VLEALATLHDIEDIEHEIGAYALDPTAYQTTANLPSGPSLKDAVPPFSGCAITSRVVQGSRFSSGSPINDT
jgi:hypothetical protein